MAIHQVLNRLSWGDAMGDQVRLLQRLLREWGFRSDIFAGQGDEQCRSQWLPAEDYPEHANEDSLLLVHHGFQTRLVPMIRKAAGTKAIVFHNITPAELFAGFEPEVAQACTAARQELRELAPVCERAYAYSEYSAQELREVGFRSTQVIPFAVDFSVQQVAPDETLQAELSDGCRNVLFVGRGVPNKRLEDVLRVFTAYQALYQPRSRLVLAGHLDTGRRYGQWLLGLRDALGAERVSFLGRVSAAQLSACYQTASAYLSMSRHEGFGVPLIEAMHRGVPVVAHGAAAVPETMGGAGLCTPSEDPVEVAKLLAVLDRDSEFRDRVVASQKRRAARFDVTACQTELRGLLAPWLDEG